jgi:hypothetical protein
VRGDIKAIALPQRGRSPSGIKIPLTKTTGNLTIEESIIMVLGVLAGAAEKISPKELKQKAARMSPRARRSGWETLTPIASPTAMGRIEIRVPKEKEANTSPRIMVGMVTGQDISLSRVFAWVSQGATAGEMAVAVKKRIIPSSPGIMKSKLIFLPITKERKRKTGNKMPKIITGPLE